jgi:hypothetical protein
LRHCRFLSTWAQGNAQCACANAIENLEKPDAIGCSSSRDTLRAHGRGKAIDVCTVCTIGPIPEITFAYAEIGIYHFRMEQGSIRDNDFPPLRRRRSISEIQYLTNDERESFRARCSIYDNRNAWTKNQTAFRFCCRREPDDGIGHDDIFANVIVGWKATIRATGK